MEKIVQYKVEDIFHDIPGDKEMMNMTIPPEIMEAQGWKEGDNLKIEWGDQGSIVITKLESATKAP
jgi:formylmethanofuran dehydrogenase subunit D